jgi:hypothetical protein
MFIIHNYLHFYLDNYKCNSRERIFLQKTRERKEQEKGRSFLQKTRGRKARLRDFVPLEPRLAFGTLVNT